MVKQEKRNHRIGLLASLGIHLVLFFIFLFLIAWRAPNPPLPEYGIELNFGLDDQGGGEIQPETPVGNEVENLADPATQQSTLPTATEQTELQDTKESEHALSNLESPVSLKEEKKKPVQKNETLEPVLKEELKAEFKKKINTAESELKKGEAGSHGDDVSNVGDKGSPEGKLDAKALYGTPGGGGGGTGMNLQMAGWSWADQPRIPELPDNENGKVVFEIECDDNGDIIGITTMERSLSPRAEQILKEEIRKNSLVRTSGGRVPERSKGRIIFILKTK